MFYISPYFITHLPVFKTIQENVPFLIYLLTYILIISIGAILVYYIALFISKKINRKNNKHKENIEQIKVKTKEEKVTL